MMIHEERIISKLEDKVRALEEEIGILRRTNKHAK